MNSKERSIVIAILAAVFLLVAFDIMKDYQEGAVLEHVTLEGLIATLALFGIFYVLKDSFRVKKDLHRTEQEFSEFRKDAERWRSESRKFLEGLSSAIDLQLEKWSLTKAEKDVAFLLLKGLSSKEIAEIRNTAEKTVRVQATSIYAKSGISNRSELSAFFLEDLLVPQTLGNKE